MQKALWSILTLLLAGIAAPSAHADLYTTNFTCTTTPACVEPLPATTLVDFPQPTTFGVQWFGTFFPFTLGLPSSDQPTDPYIWEGFGLGTSAVFTIDDLGATTSARILGSFGTTNFEDRGILTFVPFSTPVPEPSSFALIVTGIGLLLMNLKRTLVKVVPRISLTN